jgi:hypothetical protein
MDCHDGATCKEYFNITSPGTDTGRGVAEYVTMNDLTTATGMWNGFNVNCGTGAAVTDSAGSNFLIYWDADEARELENGTSITKPGGSTLLNASGTARRATAPRALRRSPRICWATGARNSCCAKRATRPCVCTQRPT